MSVDPLEDAKSLEAADRVLNTLAGMGQDAVVLAHVLGQRRRLGRFVRRDGVRVILPEALVPRITDQRSIVGQSNPGGSEQGQIVHRAEGGGDAHDHVHRHFDQNLYLQGVTLCLAAVPAALLFLGRS